MPSNMSAVKYEDEDHMEPGADVPLTSAIVDAACDLVDMMICMMSPPIDRGAPDADTAGALTGTIASMTRMDWEPFTKATQSEWKRLSDEKEDKRSTAIMDVVSKARQHADYNATWEAKRMASQMARLDSMSRDSETADWLKRQ